MGSSKRFSIVNGKVTGTGRAASGGDGFGNLFTANDSFTGEVSGSHSFSLPSSASLMLNAFGYWFNDFGNTVASTDIFFTGSYMAVEITQGATVARQAIVQHDIWDDRYITYSYSGLTTLDAGSYAVRLRVYHDVGGLVNLSANGLDFTATFGFTAIVGQNNGEELML